jgi:hypothetical protein
LSTTLNANSIWVTETLRSFTDLIVSFMAGDAALYSHDNSLMTWLSGTEILLNILCCGTGSGF